MIARATPFLPLLATAVVLGATSCGGEDDAPNQLSAAAGEGRQIFRTSGCSACHGSDGQGGVGPALASALGTEVELTDGSKVTVDQAYLERAISDPSAQVSAGYTVAMPDNDLTADEIDTVVAYIIELNGETPETTE